MTLNSSDWSYKSTCVLKEFSVFISFAEFHSKFLGFLPLVVIKVVAYKRDHMSYWVGWWGISPKWISFKEVSHTYNPVQYMVAMAVMQHAIY